MGDRRSRAAQLANVLEAGRALGTFRSDDWLGEIDVPVSVVLTTDDGVVPPARQHLLPELLPSAHVLPIAAGHDAGIRAPEVFVPTLVHAVNSVITRPRARPSIQQHVVMAFPGPPDRL